MDSARLTVTLTSAGAEVSATVAGSQYDIVASAAGDGLENYTITYTVGTLTVNPKTASVSPNTKSKIYGDGDPALDGTLTGFLWFRPQALGRLTAAV